VTSVGNARRELRTFLLYFDMYPGTPPDLLHIELRNLANESEFNVIHWAIWRMEETWISKYRKSLRPHLDRPSKGGWVALHLAAWDGEIGILNLLWDMGASIMALDNLGWTALHWAASGGSEEAIKWLVQKGISVNERTKRGETALHIAAERGRFNVIKTLIEVGVNISAKDIARETASDVALLAPVKWRAATRKALHDY
jgi:Ankyrin repeats (3 copies)